MSMIGKIILLSAIGLLVVICITFIRLLFEDSDAVEIDLLEIEKQDFEVPLLDSD